MWWESEFNLNLFLFLTKNREVIVYIVTEEIEFLDS